MLKAPFPYFGGKSRAAAPIWERFGQVANYVEPFFGSGAVLLQRPQPFEGVETVNDRDAYLSNFWRALQHDPEAVAHHADWPVNECDLHARHLWLVRQSEFRERMLADPDYYDARIAGWWVWGISCWIGGGWCNAASYERNKNTRPALGNAGQGVHRQLPNLGNAGKGVRRKLPHLENAGKGVHRKRQALIEYFHALADRLRHVRVCCGDWTRVLGPSVTVKHGVTAVFLDPPYAHSDRYPDLYAEESAISADVRQWAIENGANPLLRIALCGYESEHVMPDDWECVKWRPRGGYDGQNRDRDNHNRERERVWFSPHCLRGDLPLFTDARKKMLTASIQCV
jgi:site-specific DNA-adenine methylase